MKQEYLIIALYRNIIACNDVVRKSGTKAGLIGPELEGKKFGVIGAGAIGTRVASIAKALYNTYRKNINFLLKGLLYFLI